MEYFNPLVSRVLRPQPFRVAEGHRNARSAKIIFCVMARLPIRRQNLRAIGRFEELQLVIITLLSLRFALLPGTGDSGGRALRRRCAVNIVLLPCICACWLVIVGQRLVALPEARSAWVAARRAATALETNVAVELLTCMGALRLTFRGGHRNSPPE